MLAHKEGHHVKNQLGMGAKTDLMRQRVSQTEYNALSVRLEFQAGCFENHQCSSGKPLELRVD